MKKEFENHSKVLKRHLSDDRCLIYLNMVNGDELKALRLYRLNSELSSLVFSVLGHLEICLRNNLVIQWNEYFKHNYRQEFWPLNMDGMHFHAVKFRAIELKYMNADRQKAQEKILKYLEGYADRDMTNGDLISNLNFGFWNDCFKPQFNSINRAKIKNMFPYYPFTSDLDKDLKEVRKKIVKAYKLRNRIAHHEPLVKCEVDLLYSFEDINSLISYIDPKYQNIFLKGKLKRFSNLYNQVKKCKNLSILGARP